MLVFPELFGDARIRDSILSSFRRDPGGLRLLVAGSAHVEHTGMKQNECKAVFHNSLCGESTYFSADLNHSKIWPYFYTKDGVEEPFFEDLNVAERELRVFLGRDWSFGILICKDLLSIELRETIGDLGITLLAVPSFSLKTDAYNDPVNVLRSWPNLTRVIVANGPVIPSTEQCAAIFSWPEQADLAVSYLESFQLPSVVVYDAMGYAAPRLVPLTSS